MDQPPDDQHTLERHLEVGESYDMSKLNAEALKSLNAHSIDTVKLHKRKSPSQQLHIVGININMINAWPNMTVLDLS